MPIPLHAVSMAALTATLLLTAVTSLAGAGHAEEATMEPQEATCQPVLLLAVVDGDTVHGYIDTSDPSVAVRVKIRLDGIDTPETGGHARCAEERQRAAEAKAFLQQLLAPGLAKPTRKFARACAIRDDKYASRRLSHLEIAGESPLAGRRRVVDRPRPRLPLQGRPARRQLVHLPQGRRLSRRLSGWIEHLSTKRTPFVPPPTTEATVRCTISMSYWRWT